MKSYLAYISITLKLTSRDKLVLFFNYFFPLVFFFIFGQLFRAQQGGISTQVVTMVLAIGVLGNGFFGSGMRAVMDREANILRRFKVAPISAGPILVSSLVTGLINFLPSALLLIVLSHFIYGMPWPGRPLSLLVFLSIGVLAFRSLGLIIAAVVNSMQESQILIQILYFPMLFLSGATIPISVLPEWVRIVSQFLPATHLFTGLEAILGANETLAQNWTGALALSVTVALATFLGVKLFRWEKDEKLPASAKLWVLAVLAPFVLLGVYQAHAKTNIAKAKMLERDVRRGRSLLIRGARIFVGDGRVIESGSVLVRRGKIAKIYDGPAPDAGTLKAEAIEASGKTLLPGMIDVHVHLGNPGGYYERAKDFLPPSEAFPRELAAYLYSGITAVKSVGDVLDEAAKARALVNSGQRLGAELFLCGPLFTTAGGHGTEYGKYLPANYRARFEQQFLRLPKTPEEARRMVDDLKTAGVDGIKAILDSGQAGALFNRMDVSILRAIAAEAHQKKLPLAVHTGDAQDVADALDAGADGIEHGSFRDAIPENLFELMKARGVSYDPTLSVGEAVANQAKGDFSLLDRPLVLQVGPSKLLAATKKILAASKRAPYFSLNEETGKANLLRAYRAGVILVTGTDAGNLMVIHGPTVQRELELWVAAGIPEAAALQAATGNAARLLRAEDRIGLIARGREANLLLVDGNPLAGIKQMESIQEIVFRGERIDRADLFHQD